MIMVRYSKSNPDSSKKSQKKGNLNLTWNLDDPNYLGMTYHTPVFQRLPKEKKQRILSTALREFSRLGYKTANTNVIARKSRVSVGALYNYFRTKENLFLTVCMEAVRQLSENLETVESSGGDIFDKIERIFRIILRHSRQYGELINLYNEVTTEGNLKLARKLSYQMESVSAEYYHRLVEEGITSGDIAPDTDVKLFAFCLDNLFISLQFSYASEYYKERMRIYLDNDIHHNDERVVRGMMRFIRNAAGGGENPQR